MAVDGRMFVKGERAWARSAATFDAIDPATPTAFTTVAQGDGGDVDSAVEAARAAFEGGWAGVPPVRRVRLLNRLARLPRGRRRGIGGLRRPGGGKPPPPAGGGV